MITAAESYTFSNITADHMISITFKLKAVESPTQPEQPTQPEAPTQPKTADMTPLSWLIIMMFVSGVGFAVAGTKLHRNED